MCNASEKKKVFNLKRTEDDFFYPKKRKRKKTFFIEVNF